MTALRPCSRHAASTWIANCEDCTAWHRARLRARDYRRCEVEPGRR
jgi:hypothetical protein